MALAQASKSPFATLLQRSKFSSFDPKIAQVYTTHGGDAYRGNWGFKRPLPIRRRGAYITVKAVDTLEQQTEWNSAEPQASWMKNWDELQFNPADENSLITGRSQRDDNVGDDVADSEYAPNRNDPLGWRPAAIPNIHAMSNREFTQYLGRISSKRRAFFKYKQAQKEAAEAAKREADEEASQQISKTTKEPYIIEPSRIGYYLDEFAAWESQNARKGSLTRSLESVPHRSAGLHYSHFTPLQTYLSTKERKGRLVEEVKGDNRWALYYVASYAGMGIAVPKGDKGVSNAMVWGDPSKTGATKLRPESVTLQRAPEVVGKRQGLKAAKILMQGIACDVESHLKSNSYRPGSREYITAEPVKSFSNFNTNLTRSRRRYDSIVEKSTTEAQRIKVTGDTLKLLGGLLPKKEKP